MGKRLGFEREVPVDLLENFHLTDKFPKRFKDGFTILASRIFRIPSHYKTATNVVRDAQRGSIGDVCILLTATIITEGERVDK